MAGPLAPPSSSSAFSHPPPLASPTAPAHLTGTVVDVGEGAAHIIPVVEGFVLEGAIKSLPLAGRSVTGVVQQMLRWGDSEGAEGRGLVGGVQKIEVRELGFVDGRLEMKRTKP